MIPIAYFECCEKSSSKGLSIDLGLESYSDPSLGNRFWDRRRPMWPIPMDGNRPIQSFCFLHDPRAVGKDFLICVKSDVDVTSADLSVGGGILLRACWTVGFFEEWHVELSALSGGIM